MSDEALRALEKAVERMRHVLNDMRSISPCLTEQMEIQIESVASVSAILSARQEVGAVCDNCGKPLRNDAAPIHACACARLVMNPARTSEARDA